MDGQTETFAILESLSRLKIIKEPKNYFVKAQLTLVQENKS